MHSITTISKLFLVTKDGRRLTESLSVCPRSEDKEKAEPKLMSHSSLRSTCSRMDVCWVTLDLHSRLTALERRHSKTVCEHITAVILLRRLPFIPNQKQWTWKVCISPWYFLRFSFQGWTINKNIVLIYTDLAEKKLVVYLKDFKNRH